MDCKFIFSLYNKSVKVDSRLIQPGDLFFALPGARVNGELFLKDVEKRGAAAAVVSIHCVIPKEIKMRVVKVESPLQMLQQLAHFVLKKRKLRVIAVTGSIGKTTTKEFIYTLLKGSVAVSATPGNYNGQIGVPLSILQSDVQSGWIVLEMGIDRPDGLLKLTEIATPEIAVLVGVDLVHAEFFKDLKDIAQAKSQVFLNKDTKYGVVFQETPYLGEVLRKGECTKITYGSQGEYSYLEKEGTLSVFYKEECCMSVPWTILGEHNKEHFLGAVVVARLVGLSWNVIKSRSLSVVLPKGRLQIVKIKGVTFVNDAYNACFNSVVSALKVIPLPEYKGKRIAVLGDLKELGGISKKVHHQLGTETLNYVDQLFCLGKGCEPMVSVWKKEARPVHYYQNLKILKEQLFNILIEGDVVLIKGSNSHRLWKLLESH